MIFAGVTDTKPASLPVTSIPGLDNYIDSVVERFLVSYR